LGSQVFRVDVSRTAFDYDRAFSRNIGWITEWEQQELRNKTVAIAGLGGVGGAHALTLARLGVGGFHIADFDRFDVVNFNRQSGAFISSVGHGKAAVMSQMIFGINPELRLRSFDTGISDANLDDFLTGADLFVDGLDFFAIDIRRKIFRRCAEMGIPAITAAPLGFGSSYLIFMPGGMTFEKYFRLEGLPEERQYVNFALALAPRGFQREYLIDPSRLDLARHRGPSTAAAVQLCAGVVATEAVKLLLGRGKVRAVPWYHHFDAYLGRWKRGKLCFGNAGPLQRLKLNLAYRLSSRFSRKARPTDASLPKSEIEQILDLTRWAPSGDNAQPWRFEVQASDKVLVRLRVEGEERNIYDYANGQPTLLAGGFLLETMRIAASRHRRRMIWNYLGSEDCGKDGVHHLIEVILRTDESVSEDSLCPYIPIRSVDRRRYRMRPLTQQQKRELESTLGEELKIEWFETAGKRWNISRLCAQATGIRLRSPEAYRVHRKILDWDRQFSPDGVPAAAVGLDRLTLRLMRWVMQRWTRVDLMCRFLAGTLIPRVELDFLPGISCAAFFTVRRSPEVAGAHTPKTLIEAGERLQRLWLVATRLGLVMQPALAPLCFAHYGRTTRAAQRKFAKFAVVASRCFSGDESVLFLARVGCPLKGSQTTRSIRRKLVDLVE
jgi:molybdopterin/thiamine biosynthesis adenylyltransferase